MGLHGLVAFIACTQLCDISNVAGHGGKHICDAKLINKDRLEAFVIERLKTNILTEENLLELVRLVNEEIDQAQVEYEIRLSVIDAQLNASKERLRKLYDALETGKIDIDDIAPRIKEERQQIDDLERNRLELIDTVKEAKLELLEDARVKAYLDDLKDLLSESSIMERKSFLRSFIKRITVNLPQVVIDYTIPLETRQAEPRTSEVLPFAQCGSPW